MTKTVQYQNELHKFLIWDTAGQERVSFIRPVVVVLVEFGVLFNPTPESCEVIWFYELLLEY